MLIDTLEKLESVKPDLLLCLDPVVDTETNGLNPWGTKDSDPHHIIGLSIDTGHDAYYFPYRHQAGVNLPIETLEFFKPYLSNPDRVYGGFNYKFDMHMFKREGIDYPPNIEDAMLSAHLLNENEPSFRLKDLGDKYLPGTASHEEHVLMDKLKAIGGGKADMGMLPPEDVEPYACDDVRITRALLKMHKEALKHWGLEDIWKQINFYEVITAKMEHRGMLLDLPLIQQYAEEADEHYKQAYSELVREAGYDINVNSSKQVCALLGVESSAAEILEVLGEQDTKQGQLALRVLECRGWGSVVSKYYKPYLNLCDKEGTLRTSMKLHGTISGRLSSTSPNLQAVARKTDVFRVKDVFIARPGYTLVSMDYSQAEMRLACFYAKEETMSDLIRAGKDLHSSTAETLGIPRDAAKRINFGVIYGIGAEALHKQLRIAKKTAQSYLNQYHGLYPQFRVLMDACQNTAEQKGFIRMWTGRMRHYDINNPSHKAMSNLVQGGVAEMMRVAITRSFPLMYELGGYMVLQVHDQIIYEIPDDKADMAIPILKANMENFDFDPRMTADVKYGKRWGDLKKWS